MEKPDLNGGTMQNMLSMSPSVCLSVPCGSTTVQFRATVSGYYGTLIGNTGMRTSNTLLRVAVRPQEVAKTALKL